MRLFSFGGKDTHLHFLEEVQKWTILLLFSALLHI
jgi:hypothetical protein